ncbi:MAG: sulfotransferase family 2 domain-containing protein [Rhodobacteraceae bacterium]|nr:sulfotransferase family 2 domain-containing protein [Paracoccaceae bacterium]
MQDPENTLADAVVGVVGSRWRLNTFTFLDEDIGFIYFSAPASANVRTIGSLQKGVAQVRGERLELSSLRKVLNRDEGVMANPARAGFDIFNQMLEDQSVIKLAFVRDPVERFAAVFRSQFSIHMKNGGHRVKLFEFLGMPLSENLSMLDLAELLNEEKELKNLIPHLNTQRSLIAFDLVDYSFIGRHERWNEDYRLIAMEVFGCETPVFDPTKDLNIDPEGTKLFSLVDEETRKELKKAYAEDYEMIDEIEELFPDGFATE